MNDVSKKVEKSLHISQDVIAQIVTNSVNEIEGVYGIAPVMKTPRQLWFRQENFGNIRIGLVDDVLSVQTPPLPLEPWTSCLIQGSPMNSSAP